MVVLGLVLAVVIEVAVAGAGVLMAVVRLQ